MRAPRITRRLCRQWASILGMALLVGGCAPGPLSLTFLDPHGPIAGAQRRHLIEVVLLSLIVVLPVLVLTPLLAWHYRYRNRAARYTPRWSFSLPLELAIWGIPIAIVAVLAFWLQGQTAALDPYKPIASSRPPLRVDVIGYDWKWLFIYPDLHVASVGELAFPTDRPLAIKLTSATVMQSFYIPALGSQIYAMAGMVTRLHLLANRPGSFLGENTQYNGSGFAQQRFAADAMSSAAFQAWLSRVRAKGVAMTPAVSRVIAARNTPKALDEALHTKGARRNVSYFNDVPPDFFSRTVRAFHASPHGPPSANGASG